MKLNHIELPDGVTIRGSDGERYIIEGLLGKGRESVVYLVRDRRNKEQVFALKEFINPAVHTRRHITFEADLLTRLDHPSLPHIYRVFENVELRRAYMLMDYIRGKDLEVLREEQSGKCFSIQLSLVLLKPIFSAVSYLHRQTPPIVHRDIKPANIIVPVGGGEAVLVDFGIAKEVAWDKTTNVIRYGTVGYAAPEQYGKGTNQQTDIYALGATLYTLLTGTVPTDALTRSVELKNSDSLKPAYQVNSAVPVAVSDVIEHAMRLRYQERYTSVDEFWHVLCKAAQLPDNIIKEHNSSTITVSFDKNIDAPLSKTPQGLGRDLQKNNHVLQSPWYTWMKNTFFNDSQEATLQNTLSKHIPKEFIISYVNSKQEDFLWAGWLQWQLETGGYETELPAWGIQQNTNVELEMRELLVRAKRVIVVLSSKYLEILNSQHHWQNIFQEHNSDGINLIVPIYIQECRQELKSLLESIQYLNLCSLDESNAYLRLLAAIGGTGIRLATSPSFPRRNGNKNRVSIPSLEVESLPILKSSNRKRLEVFFSYSNQDELMRKELEKHLSNMKRSGLISSWDHGEIEAGREWKQETEQHLQQADIIFLLISPDFLASEYCYDTEMLQALQRHEKGETQVIPILLRSTNLEMTPFRKLKMLPKGDRPIALWPDRDTAFLNVSQEIQKVVTKLSHDAE